MAAHLRVLLRAPRRVTGKPGRHPSGRDCTADNCCVLAVRGIAREEITSSTRRCWDCTPTDQLLGSSSSLALRDPVFSWGLRVTWPHPADHAVSGRPRRAWPGAERSPGPCDLGR